MPIINEVLNKDTGHLEITTKCPWCESVQTVKAQPDQYQKWKAGVLIQIAMPDLNASQREALITGICDKCWDTLK